VEVIREAREAGVERLQVCENTRPLEFSKSDWREALRCANELGVEIQLGCKTLGVKVVQDHIRLAQEIGCQQLRIVMEEPEQHATEDNATRLLEAIVPKIQSAGMRLAVENHFDIASKLLLKLVSAYPEDVVGFCVDTANSLRSFEPTGEVMNLLGSRAYCYHLKDYRVAGSMISFSVLGAPLGEGSLDLDACLSLIFANQPAPPLYVETWTPSENGREQDIAREADWLKRSVQNLRGRLNGTHEPLER
jgi:sugar phosphate isomerase/epimerase